MIITRRSFLGVMLAAAAGPAIVRVASLMPIRPIQKLIIINVSENICPPWIVSDEEILAYIQKEMDRQCWQMIGGVGEPPPSITFDV